MAHKETRSLPVELIRRVAGFLPCTSALNLLLVSRRLRDAYNDRLVFKHIAQTSHLDRIDQRWKSSALFDEKSLLETEEAALAVEKLTSWCTEPTFPKAAEDFDSLFAAYDAYSSERKRSFKPGNSEGWKHTKDSYYLPKEGEVFEEVCWGARIFEGVEPDAGNGDGGGCTDAAAAFTTEQKDAATNLTWPVFSQVTTVDEWAASLGET
ncbi:uncharacterized protein BDZ99DRAFT_577617 [Mytilinidion resinicola]|uniref:F-box domain-containing protein n=1 Tax=Mytilinidion resinicola TaxID=574789 RepID=A0A6A6XYC3_9PEZI|nr:uncharacterized protein BDZ99DRAFT_577617 [Mytilinidion resinicola]KAF2801492.1 hypothetical protein BDZ99DRAFT_577617 [Mytilinidion resinicola]